MSTTHERLPLINEGFTFKKAGERITHSEWNAVLETFAKCYNDLVLDTDETANAVLAALAGKSEQGHTHNTIDINGLSSLITRMIASIDLSEYVTNGALNTKVSEALAHAKDSGQFDGTSATHKWTGTVLTITSASGTSSADLKGEKGDTGATGSTGPRGEKGDKGDAYILTDADKREIADDIEAVLYSAEQGLSAPQKQAARENIDAAKNDSWEKLYEITTDGDVISWGFTKFADGYDLALKAVAVKIVATNPVESAPTIPHIIINAKYIEDSTVKFKITMPVYNIISTTGNLIGCTIISNENGLWETDVYEALENVSGTLCIRKKVTSQMFSTSADEYPVLNYINISQVKSPPKFASGNTIEIWGIRA